MITAALTFAFIWSLLFGHVPQPWLLLICALLSAFFVLVRRHEHAGIISIDVLAQGSRLKCIHPMLKFWTLICLIILCVASGNPLTGLFLLATMCALAVFVGGLSMISYLRILSTPVSFLLIAGLALLFEFSQEPTGVLSLRIFGTWLTVSAASQERTLIIVARALGAVSCLNLLSLSTPMPDIIGVLRRVRCPDLMIDLMFLIYRYIFILLNLHHGMLDAAKSRLGYRDYRLSLRSTGKIYANLLARSYQFASRNFDAMESRCYETGIRFLEHRRKLAPMHIIVSAALLLTALCLVLKV